MAEGETTGRSAARGGTPAARGPGDGPATTSPPNPDATPGLGDDAATAADTPEGPSPAARLAGAIYGTLLVMSVITVKSVAAEPDAVAVLIAAVVTSFVFWVAHVYADALAAHVQLGVRRLQWSRLQVIAREEWPMVQSVFPPGAFLVLGIVGVVRDDTAVLMALGAGIVALGIWGSASARRSGASPVGVAAAAGINVAFGLVVVGLKLLVH